MMPWSFLKHRTFYIYAIANAAFSSGYGLPQTYLPAYASQLLRLSASESTAMIAMFNAPGIISSTGGPVGCPHERLSGDTVDRAPEPDLSVIVPTVNEAENLAVVIPELQEVLDRIPGDHEIIVVDGGSVDDTVEVAHALLPDADVLEQARSGKGNAVATGLEHASNDVVVMFDADGSADPAEIPAFVEALASLCTKVGLQPRLRDVGIPRDAVPMMAEDAMKQTRLLVNNPRPLTLDDVRAIYEAAW